MKYITGIHALNLNCDLDTCGDWHQSGIQWERPTMMESDESIFGDYGLEYNKRIPEHNELYVTANHIRALLDLLYVGNFGYAQGMNDDFICNEKYDQEVFDKVILLKNQENWPDIDYFMTYEYREKWLDYKKEHKIFPVIPNIEKIQNKRILSMMKEDDNEPFFDQLIIKYKK